MTTWLLAGASGFLGTALRVRLAEAGDEVVRLVRRQPAAAAERRWDPDAGELDPAVLDGVDVVVDLGGVGVFTGPWTRSRREAILASRVRTTSTVSTALAARGADAPPWSRPAASPGTATARARSRTPRTPLLPTTSWPG